MSWVYDYEAGPPGGSLTNLLDYCLGVRITTEWAAGFRGSNPVVQYQHGDFSSPRKFHPPANFILETTLRYTNASGLVTHVDGAAGHVYENFNAMKALLTGDQGTLVRIRRTNPDEGTVYMDVQLMSQVLPTQERHIFGWPLHGSKPFWTGVAVTGETPPTITNPGSAPVMDAIVDLTGTANDARLTHDATGDYVEIAGALPAGGVAIDVGAKTALRISGGADWSQHLVVNQPWWVELDPGANAMTVSESSGTAVASVDFDTPYR